MGRNKRGFTLIEILLVVVIIGIMLAVIVPRAWRANIDSKYGLVRQAGSELVSFAHQWAEGQIQAQTETTALGLDAYFNTLCYTAAGNNRSWVACSTNNSNWNNNTGINQNIPGRNGLAGAASKPEACVQDYVPPEKTPRNPFNGASVFNPSNDPGAAGQVIPGALAGRYEPEAGTNFNYYALLFQGTDSTTTNLNQATTYHAGQAGNSVEGMRNGIFMARIAVTP